MTETYTLKKSIPTLGIDINITIAEKELFLKLDDIITATIVQHYDLKE